MCPTKLHVESVICGFALHIRRIPLLLSPIYFQEEADRLSAISAKQNLWSPNYRGIGTFIWLDRALVDGPCDHSSYVSLYHWVSVNHLLYAARHATLITDEEQGETVCFCSCWIRLALHLHKPILITIMQTRPNRVGTLFVLILMMSQLYWSIKTQYVLSFKITLIYAK